MKLRTKLFVAYLQELEKEGKLGGGKEIIGELLSDLEAMSKEAGISLN